MSHQNMPHAGPVAIIGIACRFPGANGPQAFWRLLADGVDAITEVPANRFDIDAFYDPAPAAAGKISSRFGGFIADVENFDPGFFGISPREAEAMDPQQRILMEVAYEALQDAGLPSQREGLTRTGVFLGMMSDDYLRATYRSADVDLTVAAGGSRGTAAARISYALGFEGPSLVVDADRASSLTALHLACQSLRVDECSLALAGACNLILSPELSIACSRSGILSSDGRCKFCDVRADGIGRSEGCGVLVLKPLSRALEDKDRVYAIIRGSAIANNGHLSMELMRPSVQAQQALMRAALRDAGATASDLLYIEAHGTGTRVGDQVEVEALGAVFGEDRPMSRPCLIGSAKTNIGHTEAAGGIAGVIKVALALQHRLIPKSLHCEQENPKLALAKRGLRVQTETGQWPVHDGKPALAGISAFGLTGSLAHVVLEAPPDEHEVPAPSEPAPYLFPISARSAASLHAMVVSYRDWLEGPLAPESFARACYSASVHRQHHPHRVSFVASSARELSEQLEAYLKGEATAIVSLNQAEGERETLLKATAALYAQGVCPDWAALFGAEDRRFVPLPTYRWDDKPFWFRAREGERPVTVQTSASAAHVTQKTGIPAPFLDQLKSLSSGQRWKFLRDRLQKMAGRVLGLPDSVALDCSAPLRELGLTSLMAIELATEIELTLGFACSATVAFNYPTIEKLADHLLSEGNADSLLTLEVRSGGQTGPDTGIAERLSVETAAETAAAGQAKDAEPAEPIAVIGLACRFPGGAATPEEYWRVLRDGVDAITEVPANRWNISDFYDPNPEAPGKMYSRWGGFLDSIDRFDAAYFGISPREAVALDPQQRMLLEVAVEALDNSGHAPDPQNTSNSGVFVGIMNNNDFASVKRTASDLSRIHAHDSTGQATSASAGRLSYAFGFQGPSMAVDTACSSSLVAIHLACQSLRARECEMALAGGVNVIIAPEVTISFCKTRMLSPTGRCKTFDAQADGYVRGEGCGMIVLKRLADAVRDKDNILALIRGSAVNQDGRSSSLTAPNGLAQQAVVRRALTVAGMAPADVDYVEAHGTGTALGDPIEVEALGRVLGQGRDALHPFLVGSVKTNIGHLESAAGVAGLIKVILSLKNEAIPANLHLQHVNPRISLTDCHASIPTRLTPWIRNGRPRVAGVSSFGFVGTNAHVVVEEAPEPVADEHPGERPAYRLLALSARTSECLRNLAGQYGRMLSRRSVDIDDLCHTANLGRVHHEVRTAITAANTDILRAKLGDLAGGVAARTAPSKSPVGKIAFLFTGQGAQYRYMGRRLFATEPVFRRAFERCAQIIDPILQTSLVWVIHDENPEILQQTQFAQPALFALEYAMLEQWRSWGVEPDMVMGHSLGEYSAAVAAQVLSLEQAAKLVVTRGRLIQSIQASGGSAAVFASEEVVRPYVEPFSATVAIAADNAPERVLIAGEQKHLQTICDALKAKRIEVRPMNGSVAPHCPLMDPILDSFETLAAIATYNAPVIPMVSTGTAKVITAGELNDPRHWRDLIRNKVRFREGMQVLHDAGCRTFLEIGPRHTLIRFGEMCLPSPDLTWLASLSKEKHDQEQMLESLGQLYMKGVPVLWAERHRPFAGRKVALPTTIFETRPFWPEEAPLVASPVTRFASPVRESKAGLSQLLGERLRSPLEEVQFEAQVDLDSVPMLEDHRIAGMLLMPGAAQIVRVLAAAEHLTGRRHLELREALFPDPMVLNDAADARIAQLVLTPKEPGYDFKISSTSHADETDSAWRLHVTGHVVALEDEDVVIENPDVASIDPSAQQFSGEQFYAGQADNGYELGPTFRWLERVWLGKQDALAMLLMPPAVADSNWHGLHPGLIDSCLQVACRVANTDADTNPGCVLVPAALSGFRLFGDRIEKAQQGCLFCRISRLSSNEQSIALELSVFDQAGHLVFSIAQLHLRLLSAGLLGGTPAHFEHSFQRIVWSDSGLPPAAPAMGRERWLIFADEGGTGAALAGLLRSHGHDAVVAFKGLPHANNGHCLRLNAANPSEFNRQLAQMQAEYGTTWQGIVYLWGLDASGQPVNDELAADESSGCLGLLNLAKAMISDVGCPPLWVVTRGAQRTQRESKLGETGQAMLWGLGRVFASEHAALLGGLVDLDPHGIDEDAAAQLLDELWARDADTQVAYRANKRLVPRLRPLGKTKARGRFRARGDASYLITGAFGALGRKVAEWLTASGARHIALLSRRSPDAQAARWVEGLREQDVHVVVLQADVALMEELTEAFVKLDQSMPPLRGVMHAAGILEDNVFSKLDWASFVRVQAPKTQGSWNLHTLTADRPLDFWVVFSSVTALLGNPGQAAYVAGNAYADALVHLRRMQGAPALSINWGPWQGEGMSSQVIDDLHRRWGLIGIDPSEGVEMLGQLLSTGAAQVWAAPLDVELLKKRSVDSPHLSLLAELVGTPDGHLASPKAKAHTNGTSLLQDLPEEQLWSALVEHVVDLVRSVTGMEASEPVRSDARFEALGVDSLLTLDLLNALSRFLGLNLPATVFINNPTIELLVKYLCEEIAMTPKRGGTVFADQRVPSGVGL